MDDRAAPLECPAHEQPARARLHRDMHHPAREPADPPLDSRRRRLDLPTKKLASTGVHRVEGDLPTMNVKPSDDRALKLHTDSVQRDRCHTVSHGRYLQASNDPAARLLSAQAFNQSRSTRRADHLRRPNRTATSPAVHAIFSRPTATLLAPWKEKSSILPTPAA